MKQSFLVLYDYGQGGLWGYVRAESAEEIARKFPELTVIDEKPEWLSGEREARYRAVEEDVDEPGDGLLGILARNPEGNT